MLALTAVMSLPIPAQQPAAAGITRSNTSKLFLEVAANGSGISVDDLSDETETGAGLTLGSATASHRKSQRSSRPQRPALSKR